MSQMITCLWFDRGEARTAAEFYASVFPDSHVGKAHASTVDLPSAPVGEDLTVEFTILGQSYIGLNGGPTFRPNEAVSFMVVTETQDETDRYWNALVGHGGQFHLRFDMDGANAGVQRLTDLDQLLADAGENDAGRGKAGSLGQE